MQRWTECGGIHLGHPHFFGHPLFVWMPRKLLQLLCPHPFQTGELTSAGVRVRQVIGVSSSYCLSSKSLACKSYKKSWNRTIVSQLDIGHCIQFSCLLMHMYGCDMQVAHLMCQRGLGKLQQPM